MPETMISCWFWLFMILRMGWVEPRSGRSPAGKKFTVATSPEVPSLREALQPFSAVVLTGGSSGIGKSFIELGLRLHPDLVICNLSRTPAGKNSSAQKLNSLACDLSRPEQIDAAVAGVHAYLQTHAPPG